MAGIYIHIPFCKQSCNYCDFHFRTSLSKKEEVIEAIRLELKLRKDYLRNTKVETIYFGGGTPSILESNEIEQILEEVYNHFNVMGEPEITLEANPDDLNQKKVKNLSRLINRASVGIQSLDDQQLQFLNRTHNSQEAIEGIHLLQNHGIENISIDFIYGIDQNRPDIFPKGLDWAFKQKIPHISAYALTIENRTVFGNQVRKGEYELPSDDFQSVEFDYLIKELEKNQYVHYEISNAAKDLNLVSKHNSNYWKDIPYLGIGPGAHSYDGTNRYENVSNNTFYIQQILGKQILAGKTSKLDTEDQINEQILTGLRTIWGIPQRLVQNHTAQLEVLKQQNLIQLKNEMVTLTNQGKKFADYIASTLFM